MKNIRKLLIALGLLMLSGNAAAIMITGTVEGISQDMDLDREQIASLLSEFQAETKKEKKALKKGNKLLKKITTLEAKQAKPKKLGKKERKLARLLKRLGLDLSNFLTTELKINPAALTVPVTVAATTGEAKGVPEPSSIALLGIGLAGFAAARRFKKRS